jgi:cytochrome c peroxidase
MTSRRKLTTVGFLLGGGLVLSASSCQTGNVANDGKGGTAAPGSGLVQGWSAAERSGWYEGTQGSRLMPWSWMQALEQARNDKPFLDDAHMASFRFLPRTTSFGARLPMGFAIDQRDDSGLSFTRLAWFEGQGNDEKWIGMNCSACHTAQMSHANQTVTIDGAPSLVDFQSFIEAVDAALIETRTDKAKWDRFAARVLPKGADAAQDGRNRVLLETAVDKLIAWEKENARLNREDPRLNPTSVRYGYGRLDAFGHIFNKVSQLAVYHDPKVPGPRATPNPADAPVSYPFLWDIYRQSRLQWNGIIKSVDEKGKVQRLNLGNGRVLDYGALGRNAGEVIGVFGDVNIPDKPGLGGLPSSIDMNNLDRLEAVLRRLEPPKWPASFGALDPARVEAGRALYEQKGCKGCHSIEPPGPEIYNVRMVPLSRDSQGNDNVNNTDPWMACNAISYTSDTDKLEGVKAGYISGEPLGKTEPVAKMLSATVRGVLVAKWKQILATVGEIFFGVEKPPRVVGAGDEVSAQERLAGRLDRCYKSKSDLFAYKGRPLDGIWATAPFLHNGSVPTLYDLLLPAKNRPQSFSLGTREYDPAKVGYVSGPGAPGNTFTFDTKLRGNSNIGHDYRVGELTDEQRWALVEYMKSL